MIFPLVELRILEATRTEGRDEQESPELLRDPNGCKDSNGRKKVTNGLILAFPCSTHKNRVD
jgi:hypothetical protein